jgi:peroxiredoxin
MNVSNLSQIPPDLPVPVDDGGARHLTGLALPDLPLAATDGTKVNLAKLKGRTVVYVYPRTGEPGVPSPDGWDAIPGARGFARVHGLSTQTTEYQREAAERLHLPFSVLSDADLRLTRAIDLPTFKVAGMTLIKRMAWVIDDGVLVKVFYPVFPPDRNAEEVIAWLRAPR